MNKTNHLSVTIGTILFLGGILLLGSGSAPAADKCEVISIVKEKGSAGPRLEVRHQKVTIPVGGCTVWMNWVQRGEVQVSFRENAKACELATESPSGFHEGTLKSGETCYLTDQLPRGRTASLDWKKPGVYKYTVELIDQQAKESASLGSATVEGIIEVK